MESVAKQENVTHTTRLPKGPPKKLFFKLPFVRPVLLKYEYF